MRPLSCLLVLLLLAGLVAPGEAQRHHRRRAHKPGGSARQLRSKLRQIHQKKVQLKQQLKQTKHQAHAVLEDIHTVDARMDDVQGRLERTTDHLGASRSEQRKLGGQLVDATKKLGATKIQVAKRLRQQYIEGNGSFVSVLAGTRSAGDLASRKFLMEMIAKRDHQLFTGYQDLQADVARKKRRQDHLVVQIGQLAANQRSQKVELAQVRQEKGDVLEGLRAKQGELQRMIDQIESDESDIGAQIAAFSRRSSSQGGSRLPAFTGRFMRPVNARITSTFGMRYHPILHITRLHAGVDFGASSGTPIKAAADGVVISATYMRGFGNVVILDHGGGVSTVYGHCSRLFVSSGQSVKRGERIAAVGATGLATGPHLHWEVRIHGRPVNPLSHF